MKSDSRENIVLKLKRELRKLKEENHSLKVQLGYINAPNNSGRLPKIVQTNRNGLYPSFIIIIFLILKIFNARFQMTREHFFRLL